ncbi:hypothetical protein C8R44DRAFT_796894 [Mycena epipterygia]|nr:hypothetical protein C8R44DRAFT_796894 [Mycena epipterygia]
MYPRVATKADVLPLKEPVELADGRVTDYIKVTPGQTVLIPIIAIQRLDSVWKDGVTFRLERWLGDQSPANILVFSNGTCT